jgi:glycosyltransferase involved in cell wall biosynthesis
MISGSKHIAVVIPAYNEAASLPALLAELAMVFRGIPQHTFSVVVVDDGSTDATAAAAAATPGVTCVSLTRNFGKEAAVAAGLRLCTEYDAAILMDADLQHPPMVIPQLVAAWLAGAEMVVGVAVGYQHQPWWRRVVMGLCACLPGVASVLQPGHTDFRLLDRRVVTAFAALPEPVRVTRRLLDWFGWRTATVSFTPMARQAGRSHYSLFRLGFLLRDILLLHSSWPLLVLLWSGAIAIAASSGTFFVVLAEVWLLGDRFHWRVTGSAYLAILLLFLTGVLLLAQALVVWYLRVVLQQTSGRPLYVLKSDNEPRV